ncbi:CYTH and CHAD domain-containing protein [Luedemannella helvata]|uniref:CYTH and CHAD domain-containing protein n=1 Tax=Luedemannella helvata TaxID=349315 RepID=A0ABP4XA58_9ACTN
MLEEERKYEVDASFVLPDLEPCLPDGGHLVARPPLRLRATYYDTDDLRLARAGASLRHRRGDDEPWTVKLPTGTPGVRHEISRAGPPAAPPAELLDLVLALTRGAPVAPAATVRTTRRAYQLFDADGAMLVEVVDDAVRVGEQKAGFREVEVERKEGPRALLDRVAEALLAAGARATDEFVPKHVRALGDAARRPPDWPAPDRPGRAASAGDVVTAALRRDIARVVTHDPLVRLRAGVGDGDTAVHQMRVGCRRLRSNLRTFRALLDRGWAKELRAEVGWLADLLGAARDAEVLRARLRDTSAADPLAEVDAAVVARIDARLAAQHDEALRRLDDAMRDDRYVALLDRLLAAAREPRLTGRAGEPATVALPGLVLKPWHRLAVGGSRAPGAGRLDPLARDEVWHAVRINGKRARYAVDAVADALEGPAGDLAAALGAVQDVLGEHQDAVVAARTWLAIAAADPDDHALAVTAGRLYERERAAARAARSDFPRAWRRAAKRRLTRWLRETDD